jgi:hypothetical protein
MLDQIYFVLFDETLTLNMVTIQLEVYVWVKCQGYQVYQKSLLILQFVGFKDSDLITDNIIHITEMVCGQLILMH